MATMAQLTSARSGNRETLYGRCLCCFVTNLNYNQCNLSRVQYLRYLPPGVLIDIYVMVSKSRKNKFYQLDRPWKIFLVSAANKRVGTYVNKH